MSPAAAGGLAGEIGAAGAARLRDTGKVVFWGMALYGAVALVGAKLQSRSIGALAVQMVLAEWGAGRLGVAWTDPEADLPSWGALARRAGRGLALGLAAAALAVGIALGAGGLSPHASTPAVVELGLGVVTAALLAAREELLLRGIVVRAFRGACPPWTVLLVAGAAGAAADYGAMTDGQGPSPLRLVVAALLGVAFASLWLKDRGGWVALGAHTAWIVTTGSLIRGGLVDLRPTIGVWGGGDAGLAASPATAMALAPLTAILAFAALRAPEKTRREP